MKYKHTISPILLFLIWYLLLCIPQASADDGILIVHGDHYELTCREDGLVDVRHTILAIANITQNVTLQPTYSFEGTIVGNVTFLPDQYTYEYEPPFCQIENGRSVINITFKATLKPTKFVKPQIAYTVRDLLRQDSNGTWLFSQVFNSFDTSAPEIMLKIPKPPTQFHRLIVKNTIPAPNVFFEESNYYVFIWKGSTVTFGNITSTLVSVSYITVLNTESIGLWVILVLIGAVAGAILLKFIERGWKKWVLPKHQEIVEKTDTKAADSSNLESNQNRSNSVMVKIPEKEKKKIKKINLEQFITNHYQTFAVLGVFGGLTALFSRLENASYLTFLSFLIFIILDIDLWIRFPKSEEASLTLKIFEALLQIYLIAIGVYLVQAYTDYVARLLPIFFTLIFAGIFILVFNKLEIFEPIRRISPPFRTRSTIIRMAIGMFIIIGLFTLSMTLGNFVSELLKDYFQYEPTVTSIFV